MFHTDAHNSVTDDRGCGNSEQDLYYQKWYADMSHCGLLNMTEELPDATTTTTITSTTTTTTTTSTTTTTTTCLNPLQTFPDCSECQDNRHAFPGCSSCNNPLHRFPSCTECNDSKHAHPECSECLNPLQAFPECSECQDPSTTFPSCTSTTTTTTTTSTTTTTTEDHVGEDVAEELEKLNIKSEYRASLAWMSRADLDIYVRDVDTGEIIFYGDKESDDGNTYLDVDQLGGQLPADGKTHVENISFKRDGTFEVYANNHNSKGDVDEIPFTVVTKMGTQTRTFHDSWNIGEMGTVTNRDLGRMMKITTINVEGST